MKEIWKDVIGYEGRYEVSNLGNVRSVVFRKNGKEKSLALLNGRDYLLVKLYKDGKGTMKRVHRLVAEAFIENPNNYPVVNHKNWDKHDNRAENLEWCTYSYNNWYVPNRRGEYNPIDTKREKLHHEPFAKPKRVRCIETGEIFESVSAAARFANVEQSNVSRALRGRQRKSGGYRWEYVDEDTKNVGVLSLADGEITEWHSMKTVSQNTFASEIFDLSDLRKMKGHIRFIVRDAGEMQVCICSADYFPETK